MSAAVAPPWDALAASHGRQEARYLLRAWPNHKCAECGRTTRHVALIPSERARAALRRYWQYNTRQKRIGGVWHVALCPWCQCEMREMEKAREAQAASDAIE